MEDIVEKCKDCEEEFTITVDDQIFYTDKGHSLPKRCKSCRRLRRAKVMGKEEN